MKILKNKKLIILYLIVVAILFLITQILPRLVHEATTTTVLEYGEISVNTKTTGYILRDETVYGTSVQGDVKYLIKEGILVKVGENIIQFMQTKPKEGEKAKKSPYDDIAENLGKAMITSGINTSLRKGIFSHFIDGNETYFTYANVDKITNETAEKKSSKVIEIDKDKAVKNQPLYKIADQSKWWILCWINTEDASKYSEGYKYNIEINGDRVEFILDKKVEDGKKTKMLFHTSRYYKDFAKLRKIDIKIIVVDKKGLIVDNKSIGRKDGKPVVNLLGKDGKFTLVRVSTIETDGKKSIVKENMFEDENGKLINTVNVYDEIEKNIN
ncbi:MAG: HlyD family efflux transporter periplasmic adaptor subunit [Eubacteriales bacterium]|nr:HlyD family efflux transporter periplasmic adaptor subunit [Eubacteriales bacterium]MDY3332765.1 HlyD family efflux transporter periplasmic adaptor subunit [Gallibacter sp.]